MRSMTMTHLSATSNATATATEPAAPAVEPSAVSVATSGRMATVKPEALAAPVPAGAARKQGRGTRAKAAKPAETPAPANVATKAPDEVKSAKQARSAKAAAPVEPASKARRSAPAPAARQPEKAPAAKVRAGGRLSAATVQAGAAEASAAAAPPAAASVAPGAMASQPANGLAAATQATKSRGKEKLVRDSFTMPQEDFALIAGLKARALAFQRPTKKSELLRAGLQALQALDDGALAGLLSRLAPIKTGRPKKGDGH